jgi:hypothetical protein
MNTQTETQTTESVILEMLTENTGISMMDSGGDAGRAWQRNQAKGVEALRAEPAAYMSDGMPTLSTFHFLKEQLKFAPALDLSLRGFMQKSSNSYGEDVSDWLDFLGVPEEIKGADFYQAPRYEINTYNHQYCLLGQTLQYVCFQLNNVGYVALQIHGGADPRGGYTAPRVFEADRESLVFDSQLAQLECDNCKLSLNFYAGEIDVYESPTLNAEKFNDLVLNGPDFDLKKWDFWQAGCPNCAAQEWRG